MTLSIILFGPLEARHDGEPLGGFEYTKVRALLAYLAIEGRRQHSRSSLSTLLWPEQSDSAARQNLSQALTTLRKVLRDRHSEAPLLLTTTDSVGLNAAADIEVDVERFNALVTAAEAHRHRAWHLCESCADKGRAAVVLYRDDFLAQLYVSDSATFEEWALLRRERLRQRMLSTLERLMSYAEWRGAYDEALTYAHRQVEMEPLREGVHRTLIRLLALDGQRAAALAQYDYLRRTLDAELDEEPETATTDLAHQIKAELPLDQLNRILAPPAALLEAPTPLVGRRLEIEHICRLFEQESTRMLTLLGPPGVGKTRLALEVATALRFGYQHGVYMIELAPLDSPDMVIAAITQMLNVPDTKGSLLDGLITFLKDRHLLLVLDNFEHVVEAATMVAALLRACPALSVFVTSRTPLDIRAEQQYPLDPLPLPLATANIDEAMRTDAVRLLVERVCMVRPGWGLAEETVGTVVAICHRVEGLPLALELLAPRLRSLPPDEVLRQLDRRLSITGTAARDVPSRHRSLRSAIQWSYERLSQQEQIVFAHLGVFAGSCSVDAIEAVSGVASSVGVLESLHAASLLQPQRSDYQTRWTFLETIREFALETLEASGLVTQARDRHAAFFARFSEDATARLIGPDQTRWTAMISADVDNIRGALRWSLDNQATETAIVIGGGIWRWWWQRSLLREGLDWLERALAQPHPPFIGDAQAMRAAGNFAMGMSQHDRAKRWFLQARTVAMHFEEVQDYASATTNLGLVYRETGELDKASKYLSESIELARSFDPVPSWLKFPVLILARVRERQGDWTDAERLFAEGLQLNRDVQDAEGTGDALTGLVFHAARRGDFKYAQRCCEEAQQMYESLDHQFGLAWVAVGWGHIAYFQGNYAEAVRQFSASLAVWRDREDLVSAAEVLDFIAAAWCDGQQYADAVTFMSAAAGMRKAAGSLLSTFERTCHEAKVTTCRRALGSYAFDGAWDTGMTMTLQQAMDYR